MEKPSAQDPKIVRALQYVKSYKEDYKEHPSLKTAVPLENGNSMHIFLVPDKKEIEGLSRKAGRPLDAFVSIEINNQGEIVSGDRVFCSVPPAYYSKLLNGEVSLKDTVKGRFAQQRMGFEQEGKAPVVKIEEKGSGGYTIIPDPDCKWWREKIEQRDQNEPEKA